MKQTILRLLRRAYSLLPGIGCVLVVALMGTGHFPLIAGIIMLVLLLVMQVAFLLLFPFEE